MRGHGTDMSSDASNDAAYRVTSVKVVYGWAPSWAADIGSGGVG